ncbi:MAG: hypothetical protein GSR82_03790 [Desulfurococcales archaeon]|nr:hypothetical protein [Desulfurococcales archaeon]MEB3799273.1 hypothetical protein [Desulfurococcales archaeon]MEB3846162.1 hypothetical protein [Desulfurococcales archaeon]
MLARKGYLILPVEELLNSDPPALEELSSRLVECADRTHIVYSPSIILIGRLSQVAGTGSIIYEPVCREHIPEGFNYYELDKNEWIDTCKLSTQEYFNVGYNTLSAIRSLHDIVIVSLTRKMIYPRVFNGHRIPIAEVPQRLEEGYEVIMSDPGMSSPIVYFDGESTVYVARGSQQLSQLKALLSVEARCNHYRLLARDS